MWLVCNVFCKPHEECRWACEKLRDVDDKMPQSLSSEKVCRRRATSLLFFHFQWLNYRFGKRQFYSNRLPFVYTNLIPQMRSLKIIERMLQVAKLWQPFVRLKNFNGITYLLYHSGRGYYGFFAFICDVLKEREVPLFMHIHPSVHISSWLKSSSKFCAES